MSAIKCQSMPGVMMPVSSRATSSNGC